jgi:hypothetical protein
MRKYGNNLWILSIIPLAQTSLHVERMVHLFFGKVCYGQLKWLKSLLEFNGSPRVYITRESQKNTRERLPLPIFVGKNSRGGFDGKGNVPYRFPKRS